MVVTCEIRLFWNKFEIISVFYFTCNQVWSWNKIISAAEIISELFQRHGNRSWAAISSWNNFEIISGKSDVDEGWNNFEIISFACNDGIKFTLHLFDLLWICCTTNTQQSFTTNRKQIDEMEFEPKILCFCFGLFVGRFVHWRDYAKSYQ